MKKTDALFSIEYGLYVVTSREGDRDNGLILNAICQVTNTPNRVAVTINKSSYSYEVIKRTGLMNVNCLSTEAPFSIFQNFGFKSGREENKFESIHPKRTASGLAILPEYINAYIVLKVTDYVDLDTHGMFICEIIESKVISDEPTMSYSYYFENVKPKPEAKKVKGWVCKICGYVYEGEEIPSDFICPWCKHPASDFEPIE